VYEEFYYFYLHKQRKPANWGQRITIKKYETITKPKPVGDTEEEVEEKSEENKLATDLKNLTLKDSRESYQQQYQGYWPQATYSYAQ